MSLSGEYSVLLLLAYKCRVHYRPGTRHHFLDLNSRPKTNDSPDKWPCGQVGDVGQQHGQGSLCHGPRLNGQEGWGQVGQGWFSKLETHFWNVEIFRRLLTLARLPPKSWTVWWDRFVRIGLISTSFHRLTHHTPKWWSSLLIIISPGDQGPPVQPSLCWLPHWARSSRLLIALTTIPTTSNLNSAASPVVKQQSWDLSWWWHHQLATLRRFNRTKWVTSTWMPFSVMIVQPVMVQERWRN